MNTLSAIYDLVENRVTLGIHSEPDIACVTIQRREVGFLRSIPSLTYLAVAANGATSCFDYTAPLNKETLYRAIFYSDHGMMIVEGFAEASVTPQDNRHWIKRPTDWPACTRGHNPSDCPCYPGDDAA